MLSLALLALPVLWGTGAGMAWAFEGATWGAALLLPYLAWSSYAAYLNAGILWLGG